MRRYTMRQLALAAGVTAGILAMAGVAMAAPGLMARVSPTAAGTAASFVDTSNPMDSVDTSAPIDSVDTSIPPVSGEESTPPSVGDTNSTLIPTQLKLQGGTLRYETTATVSLKGTLSAVETTTANPDAAVRIPLMGMTVRLLASVGNGGRLVDTGQTAVTDASGGFSFDVTPGHAVRFRVVFDGTDSYRNSRSRVLVAQPAHRAVTHPVARTHSAHGRNVSHSNSASHGQGSGASTPNGAGSTNGHGSMNGRSGQSHGNGNGNGGGGSNGSSGR